jgi:ParB-like chromosome segregation protein Spo0J
MKIVKLPIADLRRDPANVRTHDELNLLALMASLSGFGQQKPIVVDKDGIVLAGNATLEAAGRLGWDQIDVVRTHLVGSQATAYAIADNRTAELAGWSEKALGAALKALEDDGIDALSLGFTAEQLAALLGEDEKAPDDPTAPDDFPEHGDDIDTDYQCPKCSYCWSGKPK